MSARVTVPVSQPLGEGQWDTLQNAVQGLGQFLGHRLAKPDDDWISIGTAAGK
jgi:hypothetical protein